VDWARPRRADTVQRPADTNSVGGIVYSVRIGGRPSQSDHTRARTSGFWEGLRHHDLPERGGTKPAGTDRQSTGLPPSRDLSRSAACAAETSIRKAGGPKPEFLQ